MTAVVNVNGRIGDARESLVPVFDHGFLYGEGVYETLRTYDRVPFLFDRHMRRLRASAEMIALPVPLDDRQLLERVDATMAALAGSGEAYIRILVTRGVGDLSYDLSATPTPSIVIIVKPFVGPPARAIEQGIAVATVSVLRNHPGSVKPLIKSNNLLNNALAMQEAIRKGAEEAVMQNYRGELAE
jgi:branched-chain amino acid aminotransferase